MYNQQQIVVTYKLSELNEPIADMDQVQKLTLSSTSCSISIPWNFTPPIEPIYMYELTNSFHRLLFMSIKYYPCRYVVKWLFVDQMIPNLLSFLQQTVDLFIA